MKRNSLLLVLTCMVTTGFSQQFIGYSYDNYAGIHNVLENPSSAAGSKYKVYVNLVSASYFGVNNAYEFDRKRLFKLDFSNLSEGNGFYKAASSMDSSSKYLWTNAEIVGPSVLVNT